MQIFKFDSNLKKTVKGLVHGNFKFWFKCKKLLMGFHANYQIWLKIEENIKGLVYEDLQFLLKIEENVKGLVHANF